MKQPIEPSDIRVGDLIRSEARGDSFGGSVPLVASEWIATADEIGGDYNSVRLYLLDRPEPAVELPTESTLGWLSVESRGVGWRRLAHWNFPRISMDGATHAQNEWGVNVVVDIDTKNPAFVAATAVPTAALDELRAAEGNFFRSETQVAIRKFLAAIDEATK